MLSGKDLDVLVLTYNRSRSLKIQLEGLCKQTLKGFKITVINNCSTDDTLEVIEKVKQLNPEIEISVITHKKNIGNAGNFISSQSIPTRKYVAVFHDDDTIHPEYLETAMKIFDINQNVIMCTGSAAAMYNVSNDNWPILFKDYYIYPKKDGGVFTIIVR